MVNTNTNKQSTHGLEQSEALTRAAQKLSRAKQYREDEAGPFGSRRLLDLADERLNTAQEAYDATFKAYTNPFGVIKSVDGRWPNV